MYNQILAAISAFIAFICGSKLARIHKAGCHTAALTGCGGREKCIEAGQREGGVSPPHTPPQPMLSA